MLGRVGIMTKVRSPSEYGHSRGVGSPLHSPFMKMSRVPLLRWKSLAGRGFGGDNGKSALSGCTFS